MTYSQSIQLYQESYNEMGVRFKMPRKQEEMQEEFDYEEIKRSKEFKGKKFLAFHPQLNKNVINEITVYENNEAKKLQSLEDAKSDR